MDADRRAAVSAGILFIIATVASVIGSALATSHLDDPAYLTFLSAHETRVALGALFELVAAGASAGIAVALYPVLKRSSAGLALGSVVFRTIEAVLYVVAVAIVLSVLALSQRIDTAGAAAASSRAIGDSLRGAHQQVVLMSVFAFSVGALLYYTVLYRAQLVPRWLSGWGLVAIVLTFVACLMALFTQNELTTYTVVLLPLAVQEMALAVWLIARGFNSSAAAQGSDRRLVSVKA